MESTPLAQRPAQPLTQQHAIRFCPALHPQPRPQTTGGPDWVHEISLYAPRLRLEQALPGNRCHRRVYRRLLASLPASVVSQLYVSFLTPIRCREP
jgi:hypothetical protein